MLGFATGGLSALVSRYGGVAAHAQSAGMGRKSGKSRRLPAPPASAELGRPAVRYVSSACGVELVSWANYPVSRGFARLWTRF